MQRSTRTELYDYIFQAWVEQSGDPDVQVPQWLRDGGPAGIELEAGSVGVFPILTDAEAARYPAFNLNYYHESHVNYSSMDTSPYGEYVS